MTLFWILAAGLALCVAIVVVWPLWRAPAAAEQSLVDLNRRVFRERLSELEKDRQDGRIDAETLAELRTELERGLLVLEEKPAPVATPARRLAGWLALVLVPLFSLLFYFGVLQPQGLGQWWRLQADMAPVVDKVLQGQPPTDAEARAHTLGDFVRVLQSRLERNPGNAEGWFMLGMSYVQLDMADPAQTAFERAWRLDPGQPRYELAYAQTRIFSNQGQLDATTRGLLEDVLQKQPGHEGAMLLLGLGAYRSGDFATAISTLEQLRAERAARHASDGPAAMAEVDSVLADARRQLAGGGKAAAAAASGVIHVKVTVDRSVAGKFGPQDVVYIFARALDGPPMPLAVVRRSAGELPLTVDLDDSQSVMPTRPLSSVREVAVTARISRHGSPDPQPGDLDAVAVPVSQDGKAQHIELTIQSVRQ
jgi:cytochrome c-type biogenesis protein CcmH